MKKLNKILNIVMPFSAMITVLFVWVITAKSVNNGLVVPSIGATLSALKDLLLGGEFYYSFLMTTVRSLISFAVCFILAFLIALLTHRNKLCEKFFSPLIAMCRALPTIAVVLLLLLFLNEFIAPIVVTGLVIFPTLYTGIKNLIDGIDQKQLEMCKLFKVERKDVVFKVIVPQILPDMLILIGTGISLNVKLMLAGEVLSATANSLGNMLSNFSYNLEVPSMFALVLFSVILGLVIEGIFKLISKKVGNWR